MDLKDPEVKKMLSGTMAEKRRLVGAGPRACRAWEEMGQVTIAAIEGFCIGGGVSLAIACDFRILGRSAYLRIPELELGLNYSWGSIPRLVQLLGPAKTKAMVILGERVHSDKCLEWGLAERVVDDRQSLSAAIEIAENILKKPPIPVAMTKKAVTAVASALNNAAIYMDADQFLLTTFSRDHEEAVRAFLEKQQPVFGGT
jgi:enoyl-CoA hydratase/carnithine racemase